MNQYNYRERHLERHKHSADENVEEVRTCPFCGAAMEEDDQFCPDCGSPREGIRCPNCGTMSRRSFCSHCNTPLNDVAHEALRQAKADPAFKRAEQLAAELAELEKQIENAGAARPRMDTGQNQEARRAASRYADLFGDVSSIKVPEAPTIRPTPRGKVLTGDILEAAIAEYKAKAQELQQTIASLLPPPSATPEEQRNFFCARKIMTVEMRATRQEWVCNFCGCHHQQPSECASPELGGSWIFVKQPTPVTKIIYG